jgi:hypothetical protein
MYLQALLEVTVRFSALNAAYSVAMNTAMTSNLNFFSEFPDIAVGSRRSN